MDSRIYRRTQTFCLALVSIGLVGVAPLVAQTTTDTFVVGGALVPNPGVPSGSLTGTVTATCSPNILTDSFGNQFTNCAITSMSIQDSNTGVTVTSPGNSILVHYVSTSAPSSGQWGITPNLIFGPDVLSNVWNSGSVQGWTYLSGGYGGTFTILPLSIVDNPEDRGASCSDSSPPPGQTHCGDPISIGTGNLFEAVIDYETAGSNKLSFTRYYNSNASNAHAVALGRNWRSNYDRFVVLSSPSSVLVEGQNGQQITFTLNAGRWSASSDRDLKLINVGTLWTLTDAYDNVETYAMAAGNIAYLTSIQARNGYTQTLQYNSSNQLTAVTDSYNRSFQFSYLGPVVGLIVTPDGIPIQYSYHFDFTAGQFDRLVGVRYFGLNTSTSEAYLYQNATFPFALTGIIDGNGTTYTTWTYDVFGRALSSQHGAGADLTTIRYNDIDRSRTVTNALGQQEVYRFTTLQGVPKLTEIDRIATATTAAAKRFILLTMQTATPQVPPTGTATGRPTPITVTACRP